MGFKEVADLDCSSTTAIGGVNKETGKKNPTSLEGHYIGTKKVESTKSKTGYASLHVLATKTGNVGVWGKTNLDQKMLVVKPGQLIRISFVGMVETRNNPMYKYKVEVDEHNTIDVASAAPELPEGEETEAYGEYEEEGETELGEEQAPQDTVQAARATAPRTRPTVPSAESQAKVKGLLGSRRVS